MRVLAIFLSLAISVPGAAAGQSAESSNAAEPSSQPSADSASATPDVPASLPLEPEPDSAGFSDGFDEVLEVGPFEITGRGFIQNDLRVVVGAPNGNGERQGEFIRNETQLMGRLVITAGEHIRAVAQARPLYTGIARVTEFNDLLDRTKIDPFWIELDDAFVEITNMGVNGLDLKLGRQAVVWGTGDMFNPTNVINARDFYDPLLFGRPISNEMVLLRYQTPIDLSFMAVYIPFFRPARLPTTAGAAFAGGATVADRADTNAIARLNAFQETFSNFGPINNTIALNPNVPGPLLQNGMAAAKVRGSVANIDMSLSYLYGRWDLPSPSRARVDMTMQMGPGGLPAGVDTITTVDLVYPRMHMIGADFSTSIEPLGGLGVWAEAGVFFPEAVNFVIEHPDLLRQFYPDQLPCEANNPCPVVRSTPFVKATVGLDYTFFQRVYLNAQYLYGFVDEFGVDFLKHYVVGTLDIKPFGDAYTLRLAGVLNLNDQSAVAFPALVLKPYPGLELYLGGLIFAGQRTQKFGKPENGTTQVFFRTRFSF